MSIENLPAPSPPERDKFSMEKCFQIGWNGMKTYFVPLLIIAVFAGVLMSIGAIPTILSVLANWMPGLNKPELKILFTVLGYAVSLSISPFVELGMMRVSLNCVDGKTPTIKDFCPTWPQFWKFIISNFIFGLAKGFGYLLFIVPGIFIDMAFHFYGYLIVDKKMGPIKALEASKAMTKGILVSIFITEVAILAVKAVGGMVFVVGILPAMMICNLARASMYRQIVSNVEAEEMQLVGMSDFHIADDAPASSSSSSSSNPEFYK